MNNSPWQRYLPWGVVGLAGVYLAFVAMPSSGVSRDFNYRDFGSLPVIYGGRTQPLDSVARNSLMIISGKQTLAIEDGESITRMSAMQWLLDAFISKIDGNDGVAASYPVFRIENEQVLDLLGLKIRPGLRYSLNEIRQRWDIFLARYDEVRHIDRKNRDLYDNKVFELGQRLHVYQMLENIEDIRCIPGSAPGAEWMTLAQAFRAAKQEGKPAEALTFYVELLRSYRDGDSAHFNATLKDFRSLMQRKHAEELGATKFEVFFNRTAPFFHAAVLYVFVFILACASWLAWPSSLEKSAFALCTLTFVLHTLALIARMVIQGRPPVTNLYSSAVFIGWGCVGLGLFLEYIFRNGMGCAVGSTTGALSLIIAHYLSLDRDTLEMMQAVLDTNFWLATHVTCITLGYTATFMAGFIGIAYVIAGLAAPNMRREDMQNLARMIYGVVCFATLLSFVGTVLGGIWADQSWGRFWGWDPKENGALLIVLMNALILHARWGGMVKSRGMAVLAILGNVVTAWSWFGVNMLEIGLHSYGFMEGAAFWLIAFVASQFLLAGLGMFDPAKVRTFFTRLLIPQHHQTKVPAQS